MHKSLTMMQISMKTGSEKYSIGTGAFSLHLQKHGWNKMRVKTMKYVLFHIALRALGRVKI